MCLINTWYNNCVCFVQLFMYILKLFIVASSVSQALIQVYVLNQTCRVANISRNVNTTGSNKCNPPILPIIHARCQAEWANQGRHAALISVIYYSPLYLLLL